MRSLRRAWCYLLLASFFGMGATAQEEPVYSSVPTVREGDSFVYRVSRWSEVSRDGSKQPGPKTIAYLRVTIEQSLDTGARVRWEYFAELPDEAIEADGLPFVFQLDTDWRIVALVNWQEVCEFQQAIFRRSAEARRRLDPDLSEEEFEAFLAQSYAMCDEEHEVLSLAAGEPSNFFMGLGWTLERDQVVAWADETPGPLDQRPVQVDCSMRIDTLTSNPPITGLSLTMNQDTAELGRQTIETLRRSDEAMGIVGAAYPSVDEFTHSQTRNWYRHDPDSRWITSVRIKHVSIIGPRRELVMTSYVLVDPTDDG